MGVDWPDYERQSCPDPVFLLPRRTNCLSKTLKSQLRSLWTGSHNLAARSGDNLPGDLTFASLALVFFRPPGTPQGQG